MIAAHKERSGVRNFPVSCFSFLREGLPRVRFAEPSSLTYAAIFFETLSAAGAGPAPTD